MTGIHRSVRGNANRVLAGTAAGADGQRPHGIEGIVNRHGIALACHLDDDVRKLSKTRIVGHKFAQIRTGTAQQAKTNRAPQPF